MPNRPWGPSHQHMAPPRRPSWEWLWRLGGWYLLCLFAYSVVHPGGQNPFGWGLKALLLGWFVKLLAQAVLKRFSLASLWTLLTGSATAEDPVVEESEGKTPGEAVWAQVARLGGGAYLGTGRAGAWVTADPESAVMALGPPRSGKTSAVMIPAVMAASGAVAAPRPSPR